MTSADGSPIDFGKYPIGTLFKVLPWHSCASIHQHRQIHVVDGDDIVDTWACADGW